MVSFGKPNIETRLVLLTNLSTCFSSVNQEKDLCIRTIEKTNRCQRLIHKMIADNGERKLAICKENDDGKWRDWIKIFGGPPTVYEGDVITLKCQAGPCYPGNNEWFW